MKNVLQMLGKCPLPQAKEIKVFLPHQCVLGRHCRRPKAVTEKPGQATTRVAVVSMATAEVKLGGSQLLVKHTTKLLSKMRVKQM